MRQVWPFLILALISVKAAAADTPFERILSSFGSKVPVEQSVIAVRLTDGKVLYEKEADKLLSPASVTKLVTAATVLVKFSPAHTFKTGLFHTGKRQGSRVLGDLVIVGDGDPFVISEKLWQLAADLRHMGITEFSGDIVIDNSLFDDEGRDESRKFGQAATRNAYDAPVSAFGVNFNTFAVALAPSPDVGKPASIGLDPYPMEGVMIENQTNTTAPNRTTGIQVRRVTMKGGIEKLIATGSISQGTPIRKVYRSVADHVRFAGEYVKAFLRAQGVQVRGKIRGGKLPEGATKLLDLEGYDMRRIVQGLNVFSNNYIADVLVKRLGAAFPKTGTPNAPGSGTYANGLAVMEDFLKNEVKVSGAFTLENGSGLDTDNRMSARQVATLLSYMEKRLDVFPEFLGSLPAAGWDGTMNRRFAGKTDLIGSVRAKTGTLTAPVSVAGLAGYFRHPKHGLVAFCILENGKKGTRQPAIADLRDRQDQLIDAWMQHL